MVGNPLISVVVPICNAQEYLPECLDSLIRQTYRNLEIILIDDGSVDGSGKIAADYANLDSRIVVFHQKNRGVGYSRNKGLSVARGEYVAFIDSDDFVSLDFFANLIHNCRNDDVVMSNIRVRYHSGDSVKTVKKISKVKTVFSKEDREKLILGFSGCCGKIYRRKFLIENEIWFFPQSNRIEDNYFTLKVYLLAKSIKIVSGGVYYWRAREGSITRKWATDKDFLCFTIAKAMERYKSINLAYADAIDRKISKELSFFYERTSLFYKRKFREEFKKNFPNLKLSVKKPFRWVYRKYEEIGWNYHSFFGDRFLLRSKRENEFLESNLKGSTSFDGKLNVCLSCDDNYSKYAGVVIASILNNANCEDKLFFYIFDGGISKENKEKINSLRTIKDCKIHFIPITEEAVSEFSAVKTHSYVTLPTYFRLKAATFIPTVDKLLYLDCDVIVNVSLRALFEMPLDDYWAAGVSDVNLRKRITRPDYINAGVILLNLEKWREDKVEAKLYDYVRRNFKKITLGDQEIINDVFCGKIRVLDDAWNVQSSNFVNRSSYTNSPNIIHYVGRKKPWMTESLSYFKDLYYENLQTTPWRLSQEAYGRWRKFYKVKTIINYLKYRPFFFFRPRFYWALFRTYLQ